MLRMQNVIVDVTGVDREHLPCHPFITLMATLAMF
jgi:hypothetical protein